MQANSTQAIVVVPHKSALLTVHTGNRVFELLRDETFTASWDSLHQLCPWATVFQSRAFVATWYQVYQKSYLPVMVTCTENNTLTGLLTMAVHTSGEADANIRNKKGRMVGAGHFEAEYQVWLTKVSDDETFFKAALTELTKQFPGYSIHFRYIPSPASLSWIESDKHWKRRCILQSFTRPLMDMSDPRLSKFVRKTEYRNKLNRLKRLGEVTFERIIDKEQFSAIIGELAIQYDFRQGAMFNKNHFRDEPLKADFLLALFEQELLHVTVLKVNEQMLAAIVAVAGKEWVHLGGINIHTPFNAKFYSPGFVHFIMLGQKLLQEKVGIFDLTPGGDFYKERMATRHDQVHELIVTNSLVYRLKRQLRKRLHNRIEKAGMWPMGMEVSLRKKVYLVKSRLQLIKKQGLSTLIKDFGKSLLKREEPKVYWALNKQVIINKKLPVHQNSLGDLLEFESKGTWMTRWEFLQDAMRRFEVGQHCYSWRADGPLLGCVWASAAENNAPAAGGTLLQGFYCHPAGRKQLEDFLTTVTAVVASTQKEGRLYAATTGKCKIVSPTLEAIGFKRMED